MLLYIWLGYILNNVLSVSFFDEIVGLVFLILLVNKKINTEIKVFYAVAAFYYIYSLFFSTNPNQYAVTADLVQQTKPYIFFYTFYVYHPRFKQSQINILNTSMIIGVVLTIGSYFYYDSTFYSGLYTHPAIEGVCMFSFAMLYLFLNNNTKKNKVLFLCILLIGLLSTRSKYYGEFIVAVSFIYFLNRRIRFNLKYIALGVIIISIILYFAMEKILVNFYVGGDPEKSARAVLYMYAPEVFKQYFPLGSGLASYATYFSAVYYSPLYDELGISDVWGISRNMYNFVADTFFPSLAQIGMVGVFLYFWFWANRLLSVIWSHSMMNYKMGWIVILYFFIDSVAAPGFVTVHAFILLYILAQICKESDCLKRKVDDNLSQNVSY